MVEGGLFCPKEPVLAHCHPDAREGEEEGGGD